MSPDRSPFAVINDPRDDGDKMEVSILFFLFMELQSSVLFSMSDSEIKYSELGSLMEESEEKGHEIWSLLDGAIYQFEYLVIRYV